MIYTYIAKGLRRPAATTGASFTLVGFLAREFLIRWPLELAVVSVQGEKSKQFQVSRNRARES